MTGQERVPYCSGPGEARPELGPHGGGRWLDVCGI